MLKNIKQIPSAIILAAGEGSRIGTPKALLKANGRSFIERVIDTLIIAGIEDITVVLGADAENTKTLIDTSVVEVVYNPDYSGGQFSSIKKAVENIRPIGDIAIFPVDHPLVEPNTVSLLIEASSTDKGNKAFIPVYKGRNGHPVLLKKQLVKDIINAERDTTLRDIIWKDPSVIHRVIVDDPGIIMDIDTPNDYKQYIMRLER